MEYIFFVKPYSTINEKLSMNTNIKSIASNLSTNFSNMMMSIENNYFNMVDESNWEEVGKLVVDDNIIPSLRGDIASLNKYIANNLVRACEYAIDDLLEKTENIKKNDIALIGMINLLKDLQEKLSTIPQFVSVPEYETVKGKLKIVGYQDIPNEEYKAMCQKIEDQKGKIEAQKERLTRMCADADVIISRINSLSVSIISRPISGSGYYDISSLTPLNFVNYSKDGPCYITYAVNFDALEERLGDNVFASVMISILKGEISPSAGQDRFFDTFARGERDAHGISVAPTFQNPFKYSGLDKKTIDEMIVKLARYNGTDSNAILRELASYSQDATEALAAQAKKAIGITLDQLIKDSYRYSDSTFPDLTEEQRFNLDRAISTGVLADNPIIRIKYNPNNKYHEVFVYTGSLEDTFSLNRDGFQFTCHRFTAFGTGQAAVRRLQRMGYTEEEIYGGTIDEGIFTIDNNNQYFGLRGDAFTVSDLRDGGYSKRLVKGDVPIGAILLEDGHEVINGGTVGISDTGRNHSLIQAKGGSSVQNVVREIYQREVVDDDALWDGRFSEYLLSHPPNEPTDLYYEFYPNN